MDKARECYIHFDVETYGKVPGLHSMISLGAVAIGWDTNLARWDITGMFSVNIEPLAGTICDPDTMDFWQKNPEAWDAAHADPFPAENAMRKFQEWCFKQKEIWKHRKIAAVSAPCGFDFSFLRYYMIRFLGNDAPFGHSCIDMKSVASTKLQLSYRESGKSNYPAMWMADKMPHTHIGVEDALEQAMIWTRILDS